MRRQAHRRGAQQRGTVLVAIIAFVLVAEVAVVALIMNVTRHQYLAADRMDSVRAFYASESGLNMAVREILIERDVDEDGAIGSISNDGSLLNDPEFGEAAASVAMSMAGGQTTLRSNGYAGPACRKTEMLIDTGGNGEAPGLNVLRYANVGSVAALDEIDWDAEPQQTTTITQISQPVVGFDVAAWPGGPTDHWAQYFIGKIEIEQAGTWTFYLESDDGSRLWIDGELVVDNDGLHSMRTRSGTIALSAAKHDIEVKWFERTGAQGLILSWSGPGVPEKTTVPARAFTH